jgi:hypothetical protein
MAPMRKGRWHSELELAVTPKDVLNVARDYAALLTHDEIALLPRGCRPAAIETLEQINEWALRLVQECLVDTGGDNANQGLLQEVSDFFVMASARLGELHSSSNPAQPA